MSDNKALSRPLFFKMLANRSKLAEKTVRRVYEEMFLLVAEELRMNGVFELPDICKITTKQQGGIDKKTFGEYMFVEAYEALKFKGRNRLLDYVNGRAVSKEAKKRRKSGRLSKSDIKLRNLTYEQRQQDFGTYLDRLEQETIDKGLKNPNRVSQEQLVRLIAKYTGMTKDSIRAMQESEANIIRYQLKNGKKIAYGNIGKFGLQYFAARKEHDGVRPYTGEEIFVEAKDAFYYPQFTFLPAFKQEIRELTEDNFV